MGHKHKVAVITGATRGIGRNTALYFARNGYSVIGTGRDEMKLKELDLELKAHGSANRAVNLDILQPDSIRNVVRLMVDEYGSIDVWINNAGLFKAIGPMWEVDREAWIGDMTTNVIGTFQCLHEVLPVLIKQQAGRVINVVGGGTAGEFKYGSGYGVSKTAIARLTENAAAELAGTNVCIFALDPGLNRTDMTQYQLDTEAGQKYLPRIKELFDQGRDVPADRAPAFAYALAEGKLDDYHGRIITVHQDFDAWGSYAADGLDPSDFKLRISRRD